MPERGDAIDRYTVLGPLGEGGMGVVVAAYDAALDRKVAIKLLRAERSGPGSDEAAARMLREAQAMARLNHPNVVTVYEVGTLDEQIYLAMEHVEGETLRAWLDREPRSWRAVLGAFLRAGRGLAAAHAAGVVHRDFKPDNVLVRHDGEIRVTDFGLAGVTGAAFQSPASALAASLTQTGAVMGTPAYMSPEQHRGEPTDERSDQFSFCVALWEALCGVRPFAGESSTEVAAAIDARQLAAPRRAVPRWLRAAVEHGLAARPEDRWPSMDALLAALERDPAAARRRWLAGAGVAVALGASVLAAVRGSSPACPAPAAALDGAALGRARAAFLATGRPHAAAAWERAERALAGRLGAWSDAQVEACRATRVRGEQSEAMLDLRVQCLRRARRQLDELVASWGREAFGVEQLDRAVPAALAAGDLAACADVESLGTAAPLPGDPERARRVEELRARLDKVAALRLAGSPAAALPLARGAARDAHEVGFAPVLAEALYLDGDLESDAGSLEVGIALLYSALVPAAEARDDALAATTLTRLLHRVGDRAQRFEDAGRLSTLADAAVARAGNRDDLRAALLTMQAVVLNRQARWPEAEARARRAVALLEASLGPDRIELAEPLAALGASLRTRKDKLDEAEAVFRRSVALAEREYGPDHPAVARALNGVCLVHQARDRLTEARDACARVLAIYERIYGADSERAAFGLFVLADIHRSLGEWDTAGAMWERSAAIRERRLAKDHPALAFTRVNLAQVYLRRGEAPRALAQIDQAVPALTRAYGERHTQTASALLVRGEVRLALGDLRAAESDLRLALSIFDEKAPTHNDRAETLEVLSTLRSSRYPLSGPRNPGTYEANSPNASAAGGR